MKVGPLPILTALIFIPAAGLAATVPAVAAPVIVTDGKTYDGQPAIALAGDGSVWVSWVGYAHGGDGLFVARLKDGAREDAEAVGASGKQIVRPTLRWAGKILWLFWTESGEAPARIMYSTRRKGKWSAPQMLAGSAGPAQNIEAACDSRHDLHVVWQEFRNGQYDILLRSFRGGKWLPVESVTADGYDDWDPAIICDSDGEVWVAWSSFRGGDYDIYIRRMSADDAGKEKRLSARGDYDLHPWLAAGTGGRVWVAWDRVWIARHAESGNSTITGANRKKGKLETKRRGWRGSIQVVCVRGDSVSEIPTRPWRIRPPKKYRIAHCALPKIAVTDDGRLWVAYRALGHSVPKKDKGKQKKNKKGKKKNKQKPYWWEVFVQSCGEDGWGNPVKLPRSDGTLEEAAVVARGDKFLVAYQMEHRRDQATKMWRKKWWKRESEHSGHHGDYGRVLGRDGDVYVASVSDDTAADPARRGLVDRKELSDRQVFPRLPRKEARHEVTVDGIGYRLLWGDLHKHSNISRCSSGNEPGPDDHYKYAQDVCQYDFVAMTDHSEHTSEYNWWRIQKLADLYHVPDFFSVLYGYEWSAKYPSGHHNVIFSGRPTVLLRAIVTDSPNVDALWKSLGKSGKRALTIPHTLADPKMGTDWRTHDERFRRVAEIFQSCRGSYEHDGCPRQHKNATEKNGFYQVGLAKGYRVGIICSSDHGWGTAYAAVYAKSNSREDVWQAMWDRRCYGSTTYGLVVSFDADGHTMGEEFSSGEPPRIRVWARGNTTLRSIEIMSEGKVVHAVGSLDQPIGEREKSVEWRPDSLAAGTTYYYARVIQEDDEMAWTSPVWVEAK